MSIAKSEFKRIKETLQSIFNDTFDLYLHPEGLHSHWLLPKLVIKSSLINSAYVISGNENEINEIIHRFCIDYIHKSLSDKRVIK